MNKIIITALLLTLYSFPSFAEVGASGYPIPRFLSLRTEEANVRTGPGMQYPKKWVLVKKNIPLEVISEYEDWRKIRDIQGDEGWIHKAMLSGKRTAIVKKNITKVRRKKDINSAVKAVLENGVIVNVESCEAGICKVQASDIEGYLIATNLWGVYIGEDVD